MATDFASTETKLLSFNLLMTEEIKYNNKIFMHRPNCPSLSFLNGVHETLMGPIAAHKPHPLFVGPGLEHKFLTLLATPLVITWCWVLQNIRNRTRAMVKPGGAVAQTLYVLKSSTLTLDAYRYGTHMLSTTAVVLAHDFPIQGCERTEWEKQKKCLRDVSLKAPVAHVNRR